MSSQCYEVKKWIAEDGGLIMPPWANGRGYFFKPDGTYLTFIKDEDSRNFYVPDGLLAVSKDEFVSEAITEGLSEPELDEEGLPKGNVEGGVIMVKKTDAEVRAWAEAEYDQRVAE